MRRVDQVRFVVKTLTCYLFTVSDHKETGQKRADVRASIEQTQQQTPRQVETEKIPVGNRGVD